MVEGHRLGPLALMRAAARSLRQNGSRATLARVFGKLHQISAAHTVSTMLVADDDAAQVDWTTPGVNLTHPITVTEPRLELAWIMSPPGRGSGGHQNLFRFIRFAEQAGQRCTVYLYTSSSVAPSIAEAQAVVAESSAYPTVAAKFVAYDRESGVAPDTHAILATGWETAYPSFLDHSHARRFYFVQDFEPSFYSLGSEYVLAENTYRFGFLGITAGGWLAETLARDYGMATDKFDFAADTTHYSVTNPEARSEVFFYARPVTARRAFEFGILVLEEFARLKPEVTINLAGWDLTGWNVPFAHVDHGSLDLEQLNGLYNRCAAGLVLSLSNMSLLPLELIASGVVPVVNDGPNNRMVSDNPFIEYVPTSPGAMARRMVDVLDRPDAAERVRAMPASLGTPDWSASGLQFLAALERGVRG